MPTLPPWQLQILQVVVVLAVSPLVTGVIARAEAIVQMRRGPSVLQPYRDILKYLGKETVLPGEAGLVFRVAPYLSFAGYATVPLLIPVLTSFGLPLGYMGDILGGGFVLALASFSISLAAIDSGSPFAQLGSSRLRSFGALGEPTFIFVIFTVAVISHTDLPYAMAETVRSSVVVLLRPAHLLAAAAFFMVLLTETGRMPVANHGGTLEFGMIEEARVLEHSGPGLAFLKWGSSVKQLVLMVIFANVLVVPWGLAGTGRLTAVALAIVLLVVKALGIGVAIVVIETAFGKLRLFKIPEFSVGSFLLAVLAVVMFTFEREFGGEELTVRAAAANVIAVGTLLLAFGMLRSQDVWEQLRLYGFGSALVAALAILTAATGGDGALYALGALTLAFKGGVVPIGVGFILRRLDAPSRVPSVIGVPTAVLLGVVLSGFAFLAFADAPFPVGKIPLSALAISVAVLLIGFLLMVIRPYAPSQLLGFLVLENAATLASLVIAPGLPFILAVLLFFDVLVGVVVFVVLVQYLGIEHSTVSTDALDRLRG